MTRATAAPVGDDENGGYLAFPISGDEALEGTGDTEPEALRDLADQLEAVGGSNGD